MNLFRLNENFDIVVEDEVWLVPEFAELLDPTFNVVPEGDPNGKNRDKAYKVLKYIFLMYAWKSPNSQMLNHDRHELAVEQSEIEEEWLKDMIVIKAIKMFRKIQETRTSRMLDSINGALDKLQVYFDNIDFTEIDHVTGKPINSTKDFIGNISGVEKAYETLGKLEERIKRERTEKSSLKGDMQPGMFDMGHYR